MENNKTHIKIDNLKVSIGNAQILKGISLEIPDKKITAIIGPSGCGKTTLLKTFNRLIDTAEEVVVEGKVLVDGEDIYHPHSEVIEIRRKMGLLSQKPYPLPMSIYDNVAFGPRLHGLRQKRQLDELVEKYLRVANLWDEVKDRLKGSASKLSVGQQQRLCLARGLANNPEIILADEPTSALDPVSSKHLEESFVSLKNDHTIVVVTHILRQAKRLADYIVFLYLGEVIETGPAEQVFNAPKHWLTREYLQGVIS
jgi:phosphate transport system ATP-binding protein